MYILPAPKKLEKGQGTYRLTYSGSIRLDESCPLGAYHYAKLLKQEIAQAVACDFSITTTTCASVRQENKNCILMSVDSKAHSEAYRISITSEGIHLTGCDEAGLLYGVQTLRQLIRQYGTSLPAVEIEDAPSIKDRGFYYDVSRGRIPTLDELKRIADLCSFYKLNQLQLYVEDSYLFEDFSEIWRDGTPLNAEEIMEFDAYCAALNIELVPSLSSFGHLYGVLRSKQYGHLSELEDERIGYFLVDRMHHHTVDVTNEESFVMVRNRILDYMKLFRSDKFNICADETFDLGKGKSKALADEKGVTEIYLEFLDKLCGVLIDAGKTPMFWGDIILKDPAIIRRLPKEAICLNWEYWPEVKEDNTRIFVESGAKRLYVCPAVQSWLALVNKQHDAYLNISGMCRLGHKYRVEGVLNTCWGDLGHIAHPEFATIGLIYGAAFSWSEEILEEDEINRQISLIEYGDRSGDIVSILSHISQGETANWWNIVKFMEEVQKGHSLKENCECLLKLDIPKVQEYLQKLEKNLEKLYDKLILIDSSNREKVVANILMAKGQMLWTLVDVAMFTAILGKPNPLCKDYSALAKELELWLIEYKKLWRKVAKESELKRIENVFCWYADYLRDLV